MFACEFRCCTQLADSVGRQMLQQSANSCWNTGPSPGVGVKLQLPFGDQVADSPSSRIRYQPVASVEVWTCFSKSDCTTLRAGPWPIQEVSERNLRPTSSARYVIFWQRLGWSNQGCPSVFRPSNPDRKTVGLFYQFSSFLLNIHQRKPGLVECSQVVHCERHLSLEAV